jgi:hypothetical protein
MKMERFTKMTLILSGTILLVLACIGIAVELINETITPIEENVTILYVIPEGYTGTCSSGEFYVENGIVKDCLG